MEKIDKLIDDLLIDGVCNIVDNAIKEILDRTKGNESARERLIISLFSHCIITLTNSKYNIDEKIAHSKEEAEHLVKYTDIVIKNEKQKESKQ